MSDYGTWISVNDELPSAACLAFYVNSYGNNRIVKARYIRRLTVEEEYGDNSLECEYDEQTDAFFWPEGWYEQIDNWPDYSSVRIYPGEVTHWMPLPTAPLTTTPPPNRSREG